MTWPPAPNNRYSKGHTDWVNALCPITVNGHTLLATGGSDRAIRLWDPAIGDCTVVIPVHHQAFNIVQIGSSS